MGRVLTLNDVEAAVKGGAVFTCDSGGWVNHRLELGRRAVTIGRPELARLDELAEDAWIATATANDTGTGVMRYADAGYQESLDEIAEKSLPYISLPRGE